MVLFNRPDSTPVIDLDLAILGTPPDEFEAYDAALRAEDSWVPEPTARTNLARKIKELENRP